MSQIHSLQGIILQVPHQRVKLGHTVGDRSTRRKSDALIAGDLVHISAFSKHI